MRRYLLVGASSGIGLALSTLLSRERVINFSRTPCTTEGVVNYQVDVSDRASLDEGIAALKRENNLPTDIVYLAGTSMCAPFATVKEEHYRKLWEVNYFAACHLTQALLPYLDGGHVVWVSSMAGAIPIPLDPFYSASKAAMNATLLDLAAELPNVKFCAVLPGGTRTGFTAKRLVYDKDHSGSYYDKVLASSAALASVEQSGQTPQAVAKAIYRILHLSHPPQLMPTGSNRILYLASRLLPARWQVSVLKKMFGLS